MSNTSFNYIRKIHALRNNAGLTNEELHSYLPDWTGKSSLKDLTPKHIAVVCESLQAIADSKKTGAVMQLVTPSETKWKEKKGGLTYPQYKCIMGKSSELQLTKDGLDKFIMHTIGVYKDSTDLTVKEASSVINGLNQLKTKAA